MPGAVEACEIGDEIVAAAVAKQMVVARHDGVVADVARIHEVNTQPQRRATCADLAQIRSLASIPNERRLLAAYSFDVGDRSPHRHIDSVGTHVLRMAVDTALRDINTASTFNCSKRSGAGKV